MVIIIKMSFMQDLFLFDLFSFVDYKIIPNQALNFLKLFIPIFSTHIDRRRTTYTYRAEYSAYTRTRTALQCKTAQCRSNSTVVRRRTIWVVFINSNALQSSNFVIYG